MLSSLNSFTLQFKPLLAADLERFFSEESARILCDSEVSVFLSYVLMPLTTKPNLRIKHQAAQVLRTTPHC